MYRLLLLDGHRSHYTYKFLKFYKDYKIKAMSLPLHIIYLLQLLYVQILTFQGNKCSYTKWGQTLFLKRNFLILLTIFTNKLLKILQSTLSWIKTGFIS